MAKLLAIDNAAENLSLYKKILQQHIPNLVMLTEISPAQGIETAINEQPDTIILDLAMPELDGFEVCRILKANPRTSHIPIIICTAIGNNSYNLIKGLNLGADAFISNPFIECELATQVKVMLRIKHAEDNLKEEIEKYKVIAKTLPDALFAIDNKGLITFASNCAAEIFEFKNSSEFIGKNILDLVDSKQQSKAKKLLNKILTGNTIRDFELKFKKGNSKLFLGELSASLIYNINNEINELVMIIKNINDREANDIEKLNYQKKLKLLNLKLIHVEEQERRKIAIDIHDIFGQPLSLAHINLTSLINKNLAPGIQKTIDQTSLLLRDIINASRTLTYDLSPPILFELGLLPAIKWKLEQIKSNYKIDFKYIVYPSEYQISDEYNILIYRIISELLLNIIKHAKANSIHIKIKTNQNKSYFQIIDNGVGFSYENNSNQSTNNGTGLFSIKERLESIKGRIDIISKENFGTKIQLIIPNKNHKYVN
jgi:PAS domain S-box-containing protein